jgi:DNA-binding LytR/AlgR family response regulator
MKVVLVDDERLALDELTYLLEQIPDVSIEGAFLEAKEALKFVAANPPDIIFLDISMPELGGMEFADAIAALGLKTAIVFATAYDNFAIKAFEKNALDYVLKPYEAARLFKVIGKYRALQGPVSQPDLPIKLSIWMGDRAVFVNPDDILYCEVQNNQSSICTETGCYPVPDSLSALEERLPNEQFLRTHRCFLINIKRVREASPYFNNTLVVRLHGTKKEIPVSRHYVKSFKAVFHL